MFGGITLALRNPVFIQWKVTVVNWLFAAAFLGSQLFGSKTFTERLMGHAVELDPAIVAAAQYRCGSSNFAVLGALNLYVMYNFDEQTWVYFKTWGMIGLFAVDGGRPSVWISSRATNAQRTAAATDVVRDHCARCSEQHRTPPARQAAASPVSSTVDRCKGRVVFAGPHPAIDSPDPGPAGFTGSLIIAEFESLESARAWSARDPYVLEGVFGEVEIKPVLQVRTVTRRASRSDSRRSSKPHSHRTSSRSSTTAAGTPATRARATAADTSKCEFSRSHFSGKRTVERHRMVYAAFGSLMQTDIHALGTRRPEPRRRTELEGKLMRITQRHVAGRHADWCLPVAACSQERSSMTPPILARLGCDVNGQPIAESVVRIYTLSYGTPEFR